MFSLAIDTSSPILSVAIQNENEGVVVEHEEDAGHSHGEKLVSVCDDVMNRIGCTYADLSMIVVGSGPGSFTGLRIGYAFAKGLAVSLKIPICPISSFHAFFHSHPECEIILGDARSHFYFYGEKLLPPRLFQESELIEHLGERKAGTVISADSFSGPLSYLKVISPHSIAKSLLGLRRHRHIQPFEATQVAEITPLYLRPVSAKTIAERIVD